MCKIKVLKKEESKYKFWLYVNFYRVFMRKFNLNYGYKDVSVVAK